MTARAFITSATPHEGPKILKRPKPGSRVVLIKEPPHLLQGLSAGEQKAISSIIGKPVLLVGYDADDRAELEFMDRNKGIHFVYVDPIYIKAAG